MKVHNVSNKSNNPTTVTVQLKNKNGTNTQVELKPGEFAYGEEYSMNNNLRIYERKKYLTITQESKPNNLSYNTAYAETTAIEEKKVEKSTNPATPAKKKRGRGRPAGSKDKKKRKAKSTTKKEDDSEEPKVENVTDETIPNEKTNESEDSSADEAIKALEEAMDDIEKYINDEEDDS